MLRILIKSPRDSVVSKMVSLLMNVLKNLTVNHKVHTLYPEETPCTEISLIMAVLLYALFFATAVKYILGVSLILSGSSPHAVLNESFTLTCTVTQADNLDDKVLFFKKPTTGAFASLKQTNTSCAVFRGAMTGYTASCGSGTNSSSSSTKTYTLLINRASSVSDSTDWWCELYYSYKRSRNFTLKVYSEYIIK
ncbi:uncharacterized protein LOC121390871, partial [Gigantopelta aegis]|uniref:uncharacterized protein LOC121390871 n=1 Tax=Gigantopelta aegis TaxID=1735272 RepID=UPI001B88D4CD